MLFNFGFIDSKVSSEDARCIFGLSVGYFYYFLKFFNYSMYATTGGITVTWRRLVVK
jgi:hypothetical protein